MPLVRILILFGLAGVFFCGLLVAQNTVKREELVITTYYPVPYGDYKELRSERMAVGPTYSKSSNYCWAGGNCSSEISDDTSMIMEGNVGVGTHSPQARLDVNGKIKMRQQTVSTDTDDTVVTKKYADQMKDEYILTHWGSGYGESGDCRNSPPSGYTLTSYVCVLSNYYCLSDVCMWKRNFN